MDADELDAAAEDPPMAPFVVALVGALAVLAGLGWLALSTATNLAGELGAQLGLVGAGVVVFAISMYWWSPDVGARAER